MSAAEPAAARPEPEPPGAPSAGRRWPPWLPVAILLGAGLILFLPAIRAPLFLDDYFQSSMIEGTFPSPRSPFDLYNLVGDADRSLLLDRGLLPWWSHPRLTVRFLRPLSSALLYADHRVLGNHPLLSHLHSFAWWAAAALAARSLYRRALAPRPALLATFIFALASCHTFPMIWLANREALVSGALGILGLGAILRLHAEGRLVHAAGAAGLFGLSLLGGEYAICFGGYALALALADRAVPPPRRILGLSAFSLPAAAYLVVRARLGYGTDGSGFYHDPLRYPLAFLQRVPRRLATLLAEGWLTVDPETVGPSTPAWVLALVVAVGVALLVVPVQRTIAGIDGERRGLALGLLVGSFLSSAPVLAVMPAPRVLGAPFLGIAATVALVLDRAWFQPDAEPRRGAGELTRFVALGLGFAHLVHGPVMSWLTSRNCRREAQAMADHAAELRARLPDPASAEIVLVRGLGSVFIYPFALDAKGTPPGRWRLLSLTGHVLALRKDERTLELLAPRDRGLFPIDEGNLFRGEGAPLAPGDEISVPGMRATVLEVGGAGPFRVRFEFDDPLESPSRVWVSDRFDGIRDATPPDPGFGKPFDPWPPAEELSKK